MSTAPTPSELKPWHRTDLGRLYLTEAEDFLASSVADDLAGEVQLIFTSPPFPLNRKKAYGNRVGDEYLEWLTSLVPSLVKLLTADGSLVIEMGNAWEPGRPVMSTLGLRALLEVLDAGDLSLCQQFVCHNTARLPSPVQWVNKERIRVKDAFTHVWWMAPSDRPKANNREVLAEYSPAMKKLLESGKYNSGRRPSGHKIGETSFSTDNGGAIPPNVLHVANTTSTTEYRAYCREIGVEAHPAPMQPELVEFFVRMLTDKGDLVFDPFAGSNTTGAVAEELSRQWVSLEPIRAYAEGSLGRFLADN